MKRVYDQSVRWCAKEGSAHHGRVIGWEKTFEPPEYRTEEYDRNHTATFVTREARTRYWTVHLCVDCGEVWMEEHEFVIGSWLEPEDG